MADARRRRNEYWAGLAASAAALVVAGLRVWPVPDRIADDVTQAVLKDPILVGMLRLALLMIAFYGIASVPALIVGGRWAKGMGTTGVLADDPSATFSTDLAEAQRESAMLRLANERLVRERDDLLALMDADTQPD